MHSLYIRTSTPENALKKIIKSAQPFRSLEMKIEDMISVVEEKIRCLEKADAHSVSMVVNSFSESNAKLGLEISSLRKSLISLELLSGVQQYSVPDIRELSDDSQKPKPTASVVVAASPSLENKSETPKAAAKGGRPVANAGNEAIDISRLNMRVGRIVEIVRHPDADSLYVEKVDLGEGRLRTICSGLVSYVPIERLLGITGIFMVNLKSVKMRGIESQGMLMCAIAEDRSKCEPLVVLGDDIALGDRVVVDGFPGEPDAQLNPKKKIFEQVKPEIRTDANCVAAYKGVPWKLTGKPDAIIRAPTLADAQIS